MIPLIILTIATIFSCIQLQRILGKNLAEVKNNYARIKSESDKLITENKKIKDELAILEREAEETVELYDLTKEICKSLDEDKVSNTFCDLLNRYIEISDCRFVKDLADLQQYNNCAVLPLNIEKHTHGYLITKGVKEKDKDRFHILAGQFLLGVKRAILYQKVQALAITDSLTDVFTRRYLLERFNEEIARSKKFKYNFAFLMVDIDYFKTYNDRYGHLVGDAILREVSRTIKENIRQIDLVGRYGGEEFSIILSETGRDKAIFAAERIRQAIEAKRIKVYDENLAVTVSIGLAVFPHDAPDAQTLIDKADEALYKAKQSGRNRVCA